MQKLMALQFALLVGLLGGSSCAQFHPKKVDWRVGDAASSVVDASTNTRAPDASVAAGANTAFTPNAEAGAEASVGASTAPSAAPSASAGFSACFADATCDAGSTVQTPDVGTQVGAVTADAGCAGGECATLCGNGRLDEGEECDEGAQESKGGCVGCRVHKGFQCDTTQVPSVCVRSNCAEVKPVCGLDRNDDCCSQVTIPGGLMPQFQIQVTTFALDKYEVTVGRFRQFVNQYAGPPEPDAGSHPLIAGSGWDSAWNELEDANGKLLVPVNGVELQKDLGCSPIWNPNAGTNDTRPMNCVSWYNAAAFCAWDGGRLPTDAEWQYAASGGSEERTYPWGSVLSMERVRYECDVEKGEVCTSEPVGSKPAGASKDGVLDLVGSLDEWTLDWFSQRPASCSDCANLATPTELEYRQRVMRGGNLASKAEHLLDAPRSLCPPSSRDNLVGFRCARAVL